MIKNRDALWSIQNKLILLIFGVLCVPFFVIGLLWYEKSTREIETNAIQSSSQLMMQINGQLDYYFTTLQNSTYPLLIHPLVKSFLALSPDDPYQRIVLTRKIQSELLANITFGRPDIYSISVISSHDIYVSQRGGYSMKEVFEQYNKELPIEQNYKIIGVSIVDTLPVLTILRRFVDSNTYQSAGMLVLQLKINEITRILEKVQLGNSGFVWLMDEEGRIMYHPDRTKLNTMAPPDMLTTLEGNQTSGYIKKDEKLIIYHQSDLTHWTTVSEVPLSELTATIAVVRNFSTWFSLALILSALFLIGGFSFQLTQSIKTLQRLMRKAEDGDLSVRALETKQDEIGNLNRSFNKMVGEIKQLMEEVNTSRLKEKELELRSKNSELEALHAQINPHFLYNTLEIINSHAILDGSVTISRMATALADLFRYSIGNPSEQVALDEEMRNTLTYLAIQQERFPGIVIAYDCDGTQLIQVQAMRLLIQPLVENSFKHGYQLHKLKPTYIGISGIEHEDKFVLTISDHGKGMDTELLAYYNDAFAAVDQHSPAPIEDTGLGLWNVHRRIRLTFGLPYGLHIKRSDLTGTDIELYLPFITSLRTEVQPSDVQGGAAYENSHYRR